jgi:hypothetical protein
VQAHDLLLRQPLAPVAERRGAANAITSRPSRSGGIRELADDRAATRALVSSHQMVMQKNKEYGMAFYDFFYLFIYLVSLIPDLHLSGISISIGIDPSILARFIPFFTLRRGILIKISMLYTYMYVACPPYKYIHVYVCFGYNTNRTYVNYVYII